MEGLGCPLGHTLEPFESFLKLCDTKVTKMGCRVFFSLFLVTFGNGQREEKHGIYGVGHTFPTLIESNVLHSFWPFGTHLGAWAHICVSKCLLGSVLGK